MKKTSKKYMVYLSIFISLLSFLILLISDYIIVLLDPSIAVKILILIISAIFMGVILTAGILIFNPVLSEAMVTLRRLLRIESLSNPLLLRLSTKAPGTYHHSLNVSALAQKAARVVGADSLLVRTAAYYHDIGKLENPTLFIENQSGQQIPTEEDADSIRKSAKEIISHVEDGVKIAKRYNLPENIIDTILEHHGTTKALYFYGKAKEHGLKIKKTDFKYPGPIPQSKESAILMLADCVEATTRSMPNLTANQINEIVDKAVSERVAEKQFKNSNLSERDLAAISKSLKENLLSIYHQRIEYNKK